MSKSKHSVSSENGVVTKFAKMEKLGVALIDDAEFLDLCSLGSRSMKTRLAQLFEVPRIVSPGFKRIKIVATFTGMKLYERFGYVEMDRHDVELANGATLPLVEMSKTFE